MPQEIIEEEQDDELSQRKLVLQRQLQNVFVITIALLWIVVAQPLH